MRWILYIKHQSKQDIVNVEVLVWSICEQRRESSEGKGWGECDSWEAVQYALCSMHVIFSRKGRGDVIAWKGSFKVEVTTSEKPIRTASFPTFSSSSLSSENHLQDPWFSPLGQSLHSSLIHSTLSSFSFTSTSSLPSSHDHRPHHWLHHLSSLSWPPSVSTQTSRLATLVDKVSLFLASIPILTITCTNLVNRRRRQTWSLTNHHLSYFTSPFNLFSFRNIT